jgi:predicted peroxiredoxin
MGKRKKVMIVASNITLDSVYPPLNFSIEAASSGAEVTLALSRKGISMLSLNHIPTPETQQFFPQSSIKLLTSLAIEYRVSFVVADVDDIEDSCYIPFKRVTLNWLIKEAAAADVVVHFGEGDSLQNQKYPIDIIPHRV